jgi:hypothetical protein
VVLGAGFRVQGSDLEASLIVRGSINRTLNPN